MRKISFIAVIIIVMGNIMKSHSGQTREQLKGYFDSS